MKASLYLSQIQEGWKLHEQGSDLYLKLNDKVIAKFKQATIHEIQRAIFRHQVRGHRFG